jgi:hypothetical protein
VPRTGRKLAVDDLDLREAVIGDGLLLIPGRDGYEYLYATDQGWAYYLGRFWDVVAGWKILDAVDLGKAHRRPCE